MAPPESRIRFPNPDPGLSAGLFFPDFPRKRPVDNPGSGFWNFGPGFRRGHVCGNQLYYHSGPCISLRTAPGPSGQREREKERLGEPERRQRERERENRDSEREKTEREKESFIRKQCPTMPSLSLEMPQDTNPTLKSPK